jgi:hypothetical protein
MVDNSEWMARRVAAMAPRTGKPGKSILWCQTAKISQERNESYPPHLPYLDTVGRSRVWSLAAVQSRHGAAPVRGALCDAG